MYKIKENQQVSRRGTAILCSVTTALFLSFSGFFAPPLMAAAEISVSNSSNIQAAKPGADIEFTVTYRNNGADPASNFYITQAIPFNTSLSTAAALGAADSVEYLKDSVWISDFDPDSELITKIKWLDVSVPEGSGDLSVSYRVVVR